MFFISRVVPPSSVCAPIGVSDTALFLETLFSSLLFMWHQPAILIVDQILKHCMCDVHNFIHVGTSHPGGPGGVCASDTRAS